MRLHRRPDPGPPSSGQREQYSDRWLDWLDGVLGDEPDEDATALQSAVGHFGVTGDHDRCDLLITHNFVVNRISQPYGSCMPFVPFGRFWR
jgi:hypothetical protein